MFCTSGSFKLRFRLDNRSTERSNGIFFFFEAVRNALNEIQREENAYALLCQVSSFFETSHISADGHFAAMQIDLSVRGWIGTFAALAADAIPISSRTMSFPADSLWRQFAPTPPTENKADNSTSSI